MIKGAWEHVTESQLWRPSYSDAFNSFHSAPFQLIAERIFKEQQGKQHWDYLKATGFFPFKNSLCLKFLRLHKPSLWVAEKEAM